MASKAGRRDPRVGQQAFLFAANDTKRCNQCWKVLPLGQFVGKSGKITQDCNGCRARFAQGVEDYRTGLRTRAVGGHRVRFALTSGNRKTGPIPVSMTSSETCPPSCSFMNAGCYGENHLMRHHWRNTVKHGVTWEEFCERVAQLPPGTIWRHNEVGDLPGTGLALDHEALCMLVLANVGKRGFTYTHKLLAKDWDVLRWATQCGFTINASADSMEQADAYMDAGLPTTVVVSHTCQVNRLETPKGRLVVVCPATRTDITCAQCKLCAVGHRKSVVGFPAHGGLKNLVSKIVRRK